MGAEENGGLGPLPRIHPRERIVTEARLELMNAINDIRKKYELTTGEHMQVVNSELSSVFGSIAKYSIREERHGNSETPGGWAAEDPAFTIHHWDTFDNETIQIGTADTIEEANAFVLKEYEGRIDESGADRVDIVNKNRDVVDTFQVK